MSPPPANRVGRYELCGPISSGGTATVYFARQLGPLGFERIVAIKSVHPGAVAAPKFRAMLEDEARILSRIRHPNVIAPVDVVLAGSELLLVLEYVPGETVSRLLHTLSESGEHVPVDLAVMIVGGCLRGLHAAHEATDTQGRPLAIVHRDVSPQNILVGEDGVPRVFDFGIAQAFDRTQTTEEGVLKGKLAYMSPEQLSGGDIDRRTDVYAAGVVLWELLTGRRLFNGTTPKAICEQVLIGGVKPPSAFRPEVSAQLDELVQRALAPDPKQRFATARHFAEALEANSANLRASDLAAWLGAHARATLTERAQRIREIEARVPSPQASDSDERAGSSDGAKELLSEPGTPARKTGRRRYLLIAVAILASLVATSLIVVFAGKRPSDAVSVPALAGSATPPPTTTPSVEAGLKTDAPVVATAVAPLGSNPTSDLKTLRKGPAKQGRARQDCRIPYEIDARGQKVYRRECL